MKRLALFCLILALFGVCTAQITQKSGTFQGQTITGNPPAAPLVITTTSPLPDGLQGSVYSPFSFMATGGVTPYGPWTITSGSVPTSMSFNTSTGVLSGTPTGSGVSTFTLTVTDHVGTVSPGVTFTINIAVSPGSCGPTQTPPYQCSRTDTNVVNSGGSPGTYLLPNAGGLSGCGTAMTDPDFGNPIYRLTCASTSTVSNQSMVTASSGSGEENLGNTNATLIVLQDQGTRVYPFAFCQATSAFCTTAHTIQRLYATWPAYSGQGGMLMDAGTTPAGNGSGNPTPMEYSFTATYTGYTFGPQLYSWDFTGYDCVSTMGGCPGGLNYATPPTKVLIKDLTYSGGSTNCLPNGFGTITHNAIGGVSHDDQTFAMMFSNSGNQNTDTNIVTYRIGSGCSSYNTLTGAIVGDWGSSGTVSDTDRFKMHNVKLVGNGAYLRIEPASGTCTGTCTAHLYFWQIGTLNLLECSTNCDGHVANGYSHMFNDAGTPTGQVQFRPVATPSSNVALIPSLPAPGNFPPGSGGGYCLSSQFDQHPGYNNSATTDTAPVISATFGDNTVYPYDCAWRREILGYTTCTPGAGGCTPTVWRFGSEFTSGTGQIFDGQYAIGFASQDGNWYFFTSDWWNPAGSPARTGTLGSSSGGSTCLGGPQWKASQTIPSGYSIMPTTYNAGNHVYTNSGGTTGTTNPANSGSVWPQTGGGTKSDNGTTWTEVGVGNCRADVFVVQLR